MAVQEISDYLKNGNITHSVNMPEVHQPRAGGKRICIIHKNEPGMISQITALTTEAGLNIENMVNKSKRTWLTPCWTRPVPWTAGWLRSWPPSCCHPGAHPVTLPTLSFPLDHLFMGGGFCGTPHRLRGKPVDTKNPPCRYTAEGEKEDQSVYSFLPVRSS